MPETNQIIQGDSIAVLNAGPEGWVDLVFADPPFNIGYLYHGYNDEQQRRGLPQVQQGVDGRGPPRPQADRVVLPGHRRRVRRRPGGDRPAGDRLPPAELDHLALHLRPAAEEQVRPQPHAHPVLHEGREGVHVQSRRRPRGQRPPDDLQGRPGQPQGEAAGRRLVPPPAGGARSRCSTPAATPGT